MTKQAFERTRRVIELKRQDWFEEVQVVTSAFGVLTDEDDVSSGSEFYRVVQPSSLVPRGEAQTFRPLTIKRGTISIVREFFSLFCLCESSASRSPRGQQNWRA